MMLQLLLMLLLVLLSLGIIILEECQALLLIKSSHHLRRRLPRSGILLYSSTATAEKKATPTTNNSPDTTTTNERRSNDNNHSSSSNNEIHDHPTSLATANTLLEEEVGYAFYQKLLELDTYIHLHGHCRVPKRYTHNPSLGNWVNKQRQQYKKYVALGDSGRRSGGHDVVKTTSMNETRIRALNQRGFIWDATTSTRTTTTTLSSISDDHNDNTAWEKMYNQLVEYYTIDKHCNVPSTTSLGQWVVRQRFHYRRQQQQEQQQQHQSSLTTNECRIQLLNELNFKWQTYNEQIWELRIQQLQEFASIYGHVCVPRSYTANPQLGSWVATQRKYYNKNLLQQQQHQQQHGSSVLGGGGDRERRGLDSNFSITTTCPLTKERINQLDEMGFVWRYWDYNFNKKINQ